METRQLVNKVWSLCNILRDDGITYQDYLTELSWLLYLCLAAKQSSSNGDGHIAGAWERLLSAPEDSLLSQYSDELTRLETSQDPQIAQIFAGARSSIGNSAALSALLREIDNLNLDRLSTQALGDIYEGILERNATELKSGAGQYFTPRSVVELMVRVLAPKSGEIVQDPAAGTGGFLVAANAYATKSSKESAINGSGRGVFNYYGVELVQSAYRLCIMNLSLHSVNARVFHGNALSSLATKLPSPDVILTNPPFGSRRGVGVIDRPDLPFPNSNKQLAFLQHAYQTLKPGGRAAIVVPDGVLFDPGMGRRVRAELLRQCDLHTILRLPTGLFYAQGIKTNVLFFRRPKSAKRGDATKRVWIYDARTGISARSGQLAVWSTFENFERTYAMSSKDRSIAAQEDPRLTSTTREEIAYNDDRLDMQFALHDSEESPPRDPAKSLTDLKTALADALAIVQDLENLLSRNSESR